MLAALACVLQVTETMLPHPIPGVRFGLANMVTLIALVQMGPARAVGVVLLRTLVSSLILGTFLTPSFILSFSGGLVSTLVMILLHAVSVRRLFVRFSFVGISVAGSVAHVLTQLVLVYLLFVTTRGVWLIWPWLALSAVVMGVITGLIAGQVFAQMASAPRPDAAPPVVGQGASSVRSQYVPGTTVLHRAPALLKILAVIALAVLVIVRVRLPWYAGIAVVLAAVTALARIRMSVLALGLRRLLALVVFSFVMPVLFSPWGTVVFTAGPLRVTHDGLLSGGLFAARIVILFWATALLAATTDPKDTATALASLLSPLRVIGVSSDRIAEALVLAWTFFPVLWQNARRLLSARDKGQRFWESLVRFPGTLVANLYLMADAMSDSVPRTGRTTGPDLPG